MKTIYSKALKPTAIAAAIALLILALGVAGLVWDFLPVDWGLLCALAGGMIGLVNVTILIAESGNRVQLDEEKIILRWSIRKIRHWQGDRWERGRKTVLFRDISSINVKLSKGDGLIALDTRFYEFVLHNGVRFEETFFHYGKKQEQLIADYLKGRVRSMTFGTK